MWDLKSGRKDEFDLPAERRACLCRDCCQRDGSCFRSRAEAGDLLTEIWRQTITVLILVVHPRAPCQENRRDRRRRETGRVCCECETGELVSLTPEHGEETGDRETRTEEGAGDDASRTRRLGPGRHGRKKSGEWIRWKGSRCWMECRM